MNNKSPTSLTVRRSGCPLLENLVRLLSWHLVIPQLLQLQFLCLVRLLLVLMNQLVDIGATMSSGNVPGRAVVELFRISQVHLPDTLSTFVQEQYTVRSSLLYSLSVEVISVRPLRLIAIVGVSDQARKVGLVVSALLGEFVDCEGGWDRGYRDVET